MDERRPTSSGVESGWGSADEKERASMETSSKYCVFFNEIEFEYKDGYI